MTSNQQSSNEAQSFDTFIPSIVKVTKTFETLQRRLEKLEQVNSRLIIFNESFSAFLYGIAVTDATSVWPERPQESDLEFLEHNKVVEANEPEIKEPVEPKVLNNRKRKTPPTKEPIQSKKRFVSNVNISQIIDRLPLMYREQTEHMANMKALLKTLRLHPNGLTMKELVSEVKLPQYTVTVCINALIHSKDAVKSNEKGSYSKYSLDPEKFPSVNKN